MRLPLLAVCTLLTACSPTGTLMSGVIYDGPGESASALSGGRVRVVDELGEELGEAIADVDGSFALKVPSGINLFAIVDADGFVPSTFAGLTGADTEFVVPENTLYALPDSEVNGVLSSFAGCNEGTGLGLLVAEVRVYGLQTDAGDQPTVAVAEGTVVASDGRYINGCYYDESGENYDPEAVASGVAGQVIVPGLEAGVHFFEVAYEHVDGSWYTTEYPIYVPSGASVVPFYPAWVEF